ncbi:hypothetical protein MKEN_01477700 [Mycena kentingensis (nom. inval.)]|nr:hypothetical protein MKEN_01477700 [Mycena kentingensis (nom. inval.)]
MPTLNPIFQVVRRLPHTGSITCATVSGDGSFFAFGGNRGTTVWKVATAERFIKIPIPDTSEPTTALLFESPADFPGIYLYTGKQGGQVEGGSVLGFILPRDGAEQFEQHFHRRFPDAAGEIRSLIYDPGSTMLIACSYQGIIQKFRVTLAHPTEPAQRKLNAMLEAAVSTEDLCPNILAFNPSQPQQFCLISRRSDGPIFDVNMADGTTMKEEFLGRCIGSADLSWKHDVMLVDDRAGARLVRIQSHAVQRDYNVPNVAEPPEAFARHVAFAEDASLAIVPSDHGALYIFDVQSGDLLQKLQLIPSGRVLGVKVATIHNKTMIFANTVISGTHGEEQKLSRNICESDWLPAPDLQRPHAMEQTFNANMELIPAGAVFKEPRARHRTAGDDGGRERVVKYQAVAGPTQQRADAANENAEYSASKARTANRNATHLNRELARSQTALADAHMQLANARAEIEQLKSSSGVEARAEEIAQQQLATYTTQADANAAKYYQEYFETEMNKKIAQLTENLQQVQLRQDIRERDLDQRARQSDARQTEQENLIAALASRVATPAPNTSATFPRMPPQLSQLASPDTREQRRVAFIARKRPNAIPTVFAARARDNTSLADDQSPTASSETAPNTSATPRTRHARGIQFDDPNIRDILRELVEEVLGALGYGKKGAAVTAGRRPSEWDKRRRETENKIGSAAHKQWLRIVLEFWRAIFNIGTYYDFASYQPADVALVTECAAGKARPDPTKFILDFASGSGWRTSTWNLTTVADIRRAIVDARNRDPLKLGAVDVPDAYIESLLHATLKRSHDQWKLPKPRGSETPKEATQRVKKTFERRQTNTKRTARKQQKLQQRLRTVKTAIKILQAAHPGSEDGLKGWRFFEALLEILGAGGMSSEESSIEEADGKVQKIHRVQRQAWRAAAAEDPLILIDETRHAMRVRGADPRVRKRQPDNPGEAHLFCSKSEPPPGLPEQIFNSAWLSGVRLHQPLLLEDLDLAPRDFEWMVVSKHELHLDDLGAAEEDWADVEEDLEGSDMEGMDE